MKIEEFRKRYPRYDAIDDETLARWLWDAYYKQVPFNVFAKNFGVNVNNEKLAGVR